MNVTVNGDAVTIADGATIADLLEHLELTRRWQADRAAFARLANAAYGERTGKALSDAVLFDAFSRAEPVSDPLPRQLERMARDAQALGFAPKGDPSGIVDATMLQEIAHR